MVGEEDGDIKMFTVLFFYNLHWMAGDHLEFGVTKRILGFMEENHEFSFVCVGLSSPRFWDCL